MRVKILFLNILRWPVLAFQPMDAKQEINLAMERHGLLYKPNIVDIIIQSRLKNIIHELRMLFRGFYHVFYF